MKKLLLPTVCAGLVLALAMPAHAAPGDPDPGFGTGGVVTGGLLDHFGPVDVDGSNRTVVLGVKSGTVAIARYTTGGAPDTTFSSDGRADLAIPVDTFNLVDVRVLADGSIVAIGRRTVTPGDPFSGGLWAAKVTSTGAPAAGYGTGGVVIESQPFTAYNERGSIATDGSWVIAQTMLGGGGVTLGSANGAVTSPIIDTSPAGCTPMQGPRPQGALRLSPTHFLHVSRQVTSCGDLTLFTRQSATGTVEWTKTLTNIEDENVAMLAVGNDVLIGAQHGASSWVGRYSAATGAPVAGWGSAGRATLAAGFGIVGDLAELSGGAIGVVNGHPAGSGPTTLLVDRLTPTGAIDGAFPRVSVPLGGEMIDSSLEGTSDGGVHVTAQRSGQGTLRRLLGADPAPDVTTLTPGRLLETRAGMSTVDGQFNGIGRANPGSTTKVRIAGRGGVPTGATAAVVNFTVVNPAQQGFATLYPCTPTVPNASTINYPPGAVVANSTIVKLDTNGDVCIYTLRATDLLIDINGFVS